MTVKREVNLASQAALVPSFGGIDKRPRPLDKDVIAIGRARGCDIILEAPEISTLHCLVYRTSGGFRARDCGSRTGTRVNGGPVRQNFLADEDVLQIGPFCFTVKIPPAARGDSGRPGDTVLQDKAHDINRLEHCQRSRRKLATLALKLRQRLGQGGAAVAKEAELNHKTAELQKQVRHYDDRLGELESAERDLEAERERLGREREEHLARVDKVEADLAKRLEAADEEVRARWHEFGQRCSREEAAVAQRAKETPHQRQKLDQEAMNNKEQVALEQAEASALLEKQRAAIVEAETALREQRGELARMMNDLRELQSEIKKEQGQGVRALSQENDDLRRLLADAEQRLAEVGSAEASRQLDEPGGAVEELRKDNDLLRLLLDEKEQVLEQLRQELQSRQGEPGQGDPGQRQPDQGDPGQGQPAAPRSAHSLDLDSYEAELNRDRQQLEAERGKLNQEIEQLRVRNEELDGATREMEMEMSKERADLARERVRLDRLREEIRSEVERVQRDAGIRETLAPVHKLREELAQKKPGTDGHRGADRLRPVPARPADAGS
jgi:adenylate cyclase